MKKTFLFSLLSATVMLAACGNGEAAGNAESGAEISVDTRSVGMLPDSGGVNDQSFNQGTWSGLMRYWEDHPDLIDEPINLIPAQNATSDFVNSAEQLISAGKEMVVMSGFVFEEAITQLQDIHPETKFVIIDAAPAEISDNTLGIFFAEQEAGFLAGVAAALETQTGQLGFIGGTNIPPVRAFGHGFAMGIAYANEKFATEAALTHYVYQGGFADAQAGGTLAAGIFDGGVDIIFAAAGNVGNGVIAEARTRSEAGESVFVIGVDSDQFEAGIMPSGESVILTSAVKRVDQAAYDAIDAFVNGTFEGGRSIVLTAADQGVGLPDENPNLSPETTAKVDEAFESLSNGDLVVPTGTEAVISFLEAHGFDTEALPAAFKEE